MIDYLYLLDYESDEDTGLCVVEIEPAAEADFAIEDVEDSETRDHIWALHRCFPQYGLRECFQALTTNHLDFSSAYDTLCYRNARAAEALM